MSESIMMSPVIQYGFAGFCVVQMAFIIWLVSRILKSFDRNTAAYRDLVSMLQTRPCLHNDRLFHKQNDQ